MAKPSWHDNKKYSAEPIISFKTETIHFITFLDEGVESEATIKQYDGSEKVVPSIKFMCKENDETRPFSPISKQLIGDLEKLYPLENRTFRIELIKGRTPIENIYKINEVE